MAAPNKSGTKYTHSDQERDNNSHDDLYGVNVVELVAENDAGNAISRVKMSHLSSGLVAGTDFDYMSVTNSSTDEDTLVKKLGGSGGTTVETLVITYATGADKISDSFSVLEWN